MPTNLSETTLSVSSIIQIMSPVAVAVIGGASWTIKRIIGKLEANHEALQNDFDDMERRCRKAEDKIRTEREDAIKALRAEIHTLRSECKECRDKRIEEREDVVDTYGKFGSRLTKVESEHVLHHRGDLCHPVK